MDDTSEKENESELRRELEAMKRKNDQLEKEKEEMKRRLKEGRSRIPQPISRSYLTPRDGIHNRLDISSFEKFMDRKYDADQDKIIKGDKITVDQITGDMRGYSGYMEEMMGDSNFRARSVADTMASQIVAYKDVCMKDAVQKAVADILAKPTKDGRPKSKEDNATVADLEQFVSLIINSSIMADVKAATHNQIVTVEEIATDVYRTQQDNIALGERVEETSRKIQEVEVRAVKKNDMVRIVKDEGRRDFHVMIKDYPRMNDIRKMSQEDRKKEVCKDLRDLDNKINETQIVGVWPPRVHPNNKKMRTNGKGTLRIILAKKRGDLYYEEYCQKYPSGGATYGRLIPYRTRAELEDERIFFRMVDQVARETEPHIIKEYRDIDNCEMALNRDSSGVADRLAKYNIRIVNRMGRFGSSGGPNIQLLRKPDKSIAGRAYENLCSLFYQQMEKSLRKTFNSLRRVQKPTGPTTSGPNGVEVE